MMNWRFSPCVRAKSAGFATRHCIEQEVAAARAQPAALIEPGQHPHHGHWRGTVAGIDRGGRIDRAIIAHQRGNIAVEPHAAVAGAAQPVIHCRRTADRCEQGIGGRVAALGQREIDQALGGVIIARAHWRDRSGEFARGHRHHHRIHIAQPQVSGIDHFEECRGNRHLAGAGHREGLIAKHGNAAPAGQIVSGDPDATEIGTGQLGKLGLERIAVDRFALNRGLALDKCAVESRLDIARVCRLRSRDRRENRGYQGC